MLADVRLLLVALLLVLTSAKSNVWEELLGKSLYRWDATGEGVEEVSVSQLMSGKKVVGLYFSASWCGPCRQFTPQLAQFYEKMNKKTKGKFEIIWVSGDRSEQEFAGYYQKMPWLAVPINVAQQVYQKLSPMYKVRGIPHMVFLDGEDASIYTLEGRDKVLRDPYGLEYPYKPRSLAALVPKPIKRMVAARIESLKMTLIGVLDSFSLVKVLGFVKRKIMGAIQPQVA